MLASFGVFLQYKTLEYAVSGRRNSMSEVEDLPDGCPKGMK